MKNYSKLALMATLASAAILGTSTAQAAEVTQTKNTSDATVVLEAGSTDEVTPPIEPTVPDGTTGNKGELTIDNLTPFVFGNHKLEGGSATYSITATNANIQVSDKRGTGAGWQLKVAASDFKDKTDAAKVLKGAEVLIPNGELLTTDGNTSADPTTSAVTLSAKQGGASEVLFQAEQNQGMGTWADKLNPSDVKLVVPGGNFKGEYTSTLTWTLGDTPQG